MNQPFLTKTLGGLGLFGFPVPKLIYGVSEEFKITLNSLFSCENKNARNIIDKVLIHFRLVHVNMFDMEMDKKDHIW